MDRGRPDAAHVPLAQRMLPVLELVLALCAAALWYTTGGAVWYRSSGLGAWPLLLIVLLWPLHWAAVGFRLRLSALDGLLLLFLLTAAMGVWAAYDRGPAWAKFWLIVGSIGIYYALAHQPSREALYIALSILGLFAMGLSLYFIATNDWASQPVKVPVLLLIGERIASWLPSLGGHRITPNVAGGMLATLLPFFVPLVRRREGPPWLRGFWLLCAAAAALGWLLAASRGAWLAVGVALMLWLAWHGIGRWAERAAAAGMVWRTRLLALALVILIGAIVVLLAGYTLLRDGLPGSGALANRLGLVRDSGLLARDYVFTGVGLGMYQMHLAIYTLLLHVGYIINSHNLFLDLLIEQGILGLAAYLGIALVGAVMALSAMRRASSSLTWILEAGVASLLVGLTHGLVDDVLYGSRGVFLLLAPLGVISSAAHLARVWARAAHGEGGSQPSGLAFRRGMWLFSLFAGVLALGAMGWRPLLGALYANLGAVSQARVELAVYDQERFHDPTLDQVRQREDLSRAERWFGLALIRNPANATARQRLASIALARGTYEEALMHMATAWQGGRRDSVTRLLLGDALVALGHVEEAAETVRGLKWAKSRLDGQAWSRYWVRGQREQAYFAWKTASLLDPEDAALRSRVSDLERQLGRVR